MGLSVASMNPISATSYTSGTAYVSKKPQAYPLNNDSSVSDAYVQSVNQMSGGSSIGSVEAARPVQYANASISTGQIEINQKVSEQYNNIAAAFEGVATSYGQDMSQGTYGMIGSSIDVFA